MWSALLMFIVALLKKHLSLSKSILYGRGSYIVRLRCCRSGSHCLVQWLLQKQSLFLKFSSHCRIISCRSPVATASETRYWSRSPWASLHVVHSVEFQWFFVEIRIKVKVSWLLHQSVFSKTSGCVSDKSFLLKSSIKCRSGYRNIVALVE